MAMEKRRLLIVEDDPNDFLLLKRVLRSFECVHAPNLPAARAAVATQRCDGCILDYNIDGKPSLVLLSEWRSALPDMPCIVVTGHDDDGLVREARELGARGVLHKNRVDEATIERALFGAPATDAGPREEHAGLRVLIVDDEPLMLRSVERALSKLHAVTITDRPAHALDLVALGARFDIMLADVVMPGKDGIELCRDVQRIAPATRVALMNGGLPTCMQDVDLERCGIPCLDKPFSHHELMAFLDAQLGRAPSLSAG